MSPTSMTSDERVWAAIRLEESDRVPIIPTLLPEPSAGLGRITQAEAAASNEATVQAFFRVFDEYGGWDNPYPSAYRPIQLQLGGAFPMKMKIPGVDLPENVPFQLDEEEILQADDFEKIAEIGFDQFFQEEFLQRLTTLSPDEIEAFMNELLIGGGMFLQGCVERGLKPFFLANGLHPFFSLSLMRSMTSFTQDLYYHPEPVERALERMTEDLIRKQIEIASQTQLGIWLCVEERASGFFFPPKIFERFWWPYTQRIVEALWSEGIVTLFHLDTCWDKNLTYFKNLPRGSAILELDSTTDIFLAKKILGNHLCLKGDVPAALFTIGSPQEIRNYCEERIRTVGKGGGYILGSGCSVPPDVKPENFKAFLETGRNFQP